MCIRDRGIGTLSTLLLGYKTAERLFELERIEGREDAVEPVSYTHLDVYKRQLMRRTISMLSLFSDTCSYMLS